MTRAGRQYSRQPTLETRPHREGATAYPVYVSIRDTRGRSIDCPHRKGKDMTPRPSQIAIIIPYFQREAGLLRQCVGSILAQPGNIDFHIVVVDDGSPVPAASELEPLQAQAKTQLQVVLQTNAGPGAARNTGLDHVPEGTRFVTFMDSDDQWTGPFLDDAVHALEQGSDLFIGNSTRAGQEATRFEWGADKHLNLKPGDHRVVDVERDIHLFQGDFFDMLVRRSNLIGPTTFAYRFERFPHVRFDPSIYNGQDRLFKLTLGQDLKTVAFSPKVYAFEGEGVNIFDKSQWGSEGSVRLSASYIRLSRTILSSIRLNPAQRAFVEGQLAEARYALVANVLHLLKRRTRVDWSLVVAAFKEDPKSVALLPSHLWHILLKRSQT